MKLGVLLNNVGASQLAYSVLREANRGLEEGDLTDFVVFYDALTRPCLVPRFALMQSSEAWGCQYPLIATDLSTAEKLLTFPSCGGRHFLVWDLEWLRSPVAYANRRAVYAHPELNILVRSDEHARLMHELWGRQAKVVGDFDLGLIRGAL